MSHIVVGYTAFNHVPSNGFILAHLLSGNISFYDFEVNFTVFTANVRRARSHN